MVCEFNDKEEKWYAQVLEKIIRKTNKESGVLVDIGCKRGMYLFLLAKKLTNWNFFGLDMYGSDFYPAISGVKIPSNLEYRVEDARKLNFGPSSVDIFTVLALKLDMPETSDILSNLLKSLKEDGFICISYLHDTNILTLKKQGLELVEKIKQGTAKKGPYKDLDYYFCIFKK